MRKKKVAWLTDTHLLPWQRKKLVQNIRNEKPDAVFLTGDISVSGITVIDDLEYMSDNLTVPIYFVCGNHDLWFSEFNSVKARVKDLCSKKDNLFWLTKSDIIYLNEEIAIIGADGWFDVRTSYSRFVKYVLDCLFIHDFRKLKGLKEKIFKFREMADAGANKLSKKIKIASKTHKKIYLLTHFPPWKEAQKKSFFKDWWAIYNVNYNLGQKIEEDMRSVEQSSSVTVLCGHTHEPTDVRISKNIECRVGRAGIYISDLNILYI
jgi:predicted MPP superfamily phosphohydrolase